MSDYIGQVVALLSAEFDWEPHVEEACRNSLIRAFAETIPPRVGFICDDPWRADWRIKDNPTVDRWALRMAYYGADSDNANRAKAITDQLTGLLIGAR